MSLGVRGQRLTDIARQAIGAWLDHLLGTGWILAALLTALGVIGAFASAYYRYEAQMAAHDAGKPWTRRRRAEGSGS